MENIIEICVAIDIAIIGVAYPIIVDKISSIGDKYSSQYIPVLFNDEVPQRPLQFGGKNFNIPQFKFVLYITIFSFLFLIFQFPPLFGWDNFFINNSAKITVFSFSTLLTIMFFLWLDKAALYNGKSTSLLKKIILDYKNLKSRPETEYHLKAINEMTVYAVERQDEHLQETLLEFYSEEFSKIRQNSKQGEAVKYTFDLYAMVHRLNREFSKNQNNKLYAIEHRAVSGIWLLGEGFEGLQISEDTYRWLWSNLYVICDNERLIKMYWATAHQYLRLQLRHIYPEIDAKIGKIKNQNAIDFRIKQRERFLEHHYALGGLILYRRHYRLIKYIVEFSQSTPPDNELMPHSMTEVFKWFEHFYNEYSINAMLDIKYSFPELDNLGNSNQIKNWICKYISLLFIRQFSLQVHYVYENHTALPSLPQSIIELNNWLDCLPFFEKCLEESLSNKELLDTLTLQKTANENIDNIKKFVAELKIAIVNKIGDQKLNAPLSDAKVAEFEIQTNVIIKNAFEGYKEILNTASDTFDETDLKISLNGSTTLLSKSAFTDNDIPHINYDTVFASSIATETIKRLIPYSFSTAKTKRYLLNKDNLLAGIEKIIGDAKDVVIVLMSPDFEVTKIVSSSRFKAIAKQVHSAEYNIQNTLYILKKNSLPMVEHKDLEEKEITELKLRLINKDLNLYASVVDINNAENEALRKKWNRQPEKDKSDPKVQLSIAFIAVIHWKKIRDVVQINIASQFKEQGIQNQLSEVEPLK